MNQRPPLSPAAQKRLDDLRAQLEAENAKAALRSEQALWQRADGTPIEIPTTMLEWARAIDTRFGAIEVQYQQVTGAVEENTKMTKKVMEDTSTLVEAAKALGGVVKFLEWTGKIASPIYKFSVAIVVVTLMCVGIWTAIKSGIHPGHLPPQIPPK